MKPTHKITRIAKSRDGRYYARLYTMANKMVLASSLDAILERVQARDFVLHPSSIIALARAQVGVPGEGSRGRKTLGISGYPL